MSFYTSLTGLNAATSQLSVASNNIANVGTTGFKRSRADFGDIFATSPLQKASSTVGQGVSLKQVTQEFSQGNVTSSSNALDLAITGDGFFPMRSADGLQDIYTRNGSFMLNDQFNVVNSAGQRLTASTVDSAGNANVNDRMVLTIPQKTSGEAKQTSLVSLGLNFPAEAQVITAPFNRADPSTYNKSTAMTVYDKGGNGYLATVYYVKTQNANQNSPYNKWQTHVFVGDEQVNASLVQATNTGGEKLYVNQYGQLKPYSAVKDELTTGKTELISLDELTDTRTSVSAGVTSTEGMNNVFNLTDGVNFKSLVTSGQLTTSDLQNAFSLDVDNSGSPIKVDMSFLASVDQKLTGNDIAATMTNYLNRQFGDEAYFDLSSPANRAFTVSTSRVTTLVNGTPTATPLSINLDPADFNPSFSTDADLKHLNVEDIVKTLQAKLDANTDLQAGGTNTLKVSYDYNARTFKFTDGTAQVSLAQGSAGKNELFGLGSNPVTMDENGSYGTQVLANGDTIRPTAQQRYGIQVKYDSGTKTFAVTSGTTGDKSSIKLSLDYTPDSNGAPTTKSLGKDLFGFKDTEVLPSSVALRGIASQPAVAYGATPTINVTNNFAVDSTNNKFVVTVDGVKGTVVIPTGSDYTCLLYTSPSPRDYAASRMPSSA